MECTKCNGTGLLSDKSLICSECSGSGILVSKEDKVKPTKGKKSSIFSLLRNK